MAAFGSHVRRRLAPHGCAIFVLWPIVTLIAATIETTRLPYYRVDAAQGLLGAAAGLAVLGVDVAAIGLAAWCATIALFAAFAAGGWVPDDRRFGGLVLEPLAVFAAVLFGSAMAYPGTLAHPLLAPLEDLSVAMATASLGGAALAAALLVASRERQMGVVVVLLGIGLALPLPVAWRALPTPVASGRAPVAILGLDSLSQADDLTVLRELAQRREGTWYAHAVTPGLLTNAVWASILTMQPVQTHGIFHTFQGFDALAAADTLVTRAKRAGFRTVSVFPDQITCAVGSQAGFDVDRSGPVGWRALATPIVANASLLLPLMRPFLPRAIASVSPNLSGTFTYDVDRELDEIFGEGDAEGRAFIVGHTTYLHSPRFPSWRELDGETRRRVWWAPAWSMRDRSFDWQDEAHADDAIDLRTWKIARLERAVVASLARTRFLSPERGGQLVLLADHGDRAGLDPGTFWKPVYHHVPLVTFGFPATRDPEAPISLLDVAALVGLAPEAPPHDPAVEFIMAHPRRWLDLVDTVQLGWQGDVTLDRVILDETFRGLRLHRPWPAEYPAKVYLVFGAPKPAS